MEQNNNLKHKEGAPPQNLPTQGSKPVFEDMKLPTDTTPEHNERLVPVVKTQKDTPSVITKSKNIFFKGLTRAPNKPTPPNAPVPVPKPQKVQPAVPEKSQNTPPPKAQPSENPNTTTSNKDTSSTDKSKKQEFAKDSKSFSSLRTYENDIAKILREKNISVAQIHTAEIKQGAKSKTADKEKYQLPEKKKKRLNWNKIFIGLLILLFVLAGGAVIFSVFSNKTPEATTPTVSSGNQTPEVQSFFLVEQKTPVSIEGQNRNAILETLASLRGSTVAPLGSIAQLYFTRKTELGSTTLTLEELFESLFIEAPKSLIRNVDKDFVYGIHVFDGNQPFMVLRTNSYGHTFAGMLEWEDTLERDMKGLVLPHVKQGETQASSSADLLTRHIFKDKVVLNRDARVIVNNDGSILMLYSFVSADTVVITTNEDTLKELISRLERIRFSR